MVVAVTSATASRFAFFGDAFVAAAAAAAVVVVVGMTFTQIHQDRHVRCLRCKIENETRAAARLILRWHVTPSFFVLLIQSTRYELSRHVLFFLLPP